MATRKKTKLSLKIGAEIKKIRTTAKLTQQQMADKLGVKRAAISKYETGEVTISHEQYLKIRKLFK